MDATNEGTEIVPDIKNQGGRLLTEEFESIILEVGGSFIQEQYSGTRIHAKLLSEDSISGRYLRLEKTLDPEPADGIQAESGTADVITDNIIREDGDKILIEQQEDDNELLIQNILLEESNIEEEEGQIPHENYALDPFDTRQTTGSRNSRDAAYCKKFVHCYEDCINNCINKVKEEINDRNYYRKI